MTIAAEKEETIKVGNKIVQIVPFWKWLLVDRFESMRNIP
jgi:hypothetical protein